jgi:hypothetical protein
MQSLLIPRRLKAWCGCWQAYPQEHRTRLREKFEATTH